MVANIFVSLPASHRGAGGSDYFTGAASGLAWVIPDGPAGAGAHAAFGLALVLAAIALAAIAAIGLSQGQPGRLPLALSVVGAAFNGVSFLNYGHDFSSMIMASLWALALTCYLVGLFLAARPLRPVAS